MRRNVVTVRRVLSECKHCGKTNVEEHMHGMCQECSARYARYLRLKKLVFTQPCDINYQKLYAVVVEYKVLKDAGYRVPSDI